MLNDMVNSISAEIQQQTSIQRTEEIYVGLLVV